MIEVRGLAKAYGRTRALRGVDLTAAPGEVTGLLGPNACGKTTLIKSILGLVVPDRGEISVCGRSVGSDCEYRRLIGYLPQNPDFPPNLSVRELFRMIKDLRGTPTRAARGAACRPEFRPEFTEDELIALFALEPFLSRPFSMLSGGTKQKAAATLAFLFDPPVLILDEPTVGLDPVASAHLKGLVRKAAALGRTVLLVSHIVSEVEQLVSRLSFLLDGEVACSGTIEELISLGGAVPGSAAGLDGSLLRLMGGKGGGKQCLAKSSNTSS